MIRYNISIGSQIDSIFFNNDYSDTCVPIRLKFVLLKLPVSQWLYHLRLKKIFFLYGCRISGCIRYY